MRGRDHRSSSSDRRGAPAWQSATGSTDRRPRTAWARAPEPGRRQGRRVWPKVAVRGKSDPSRGAERDRRAAGRGGRGALRDCADVEPAPPAPTAGDRTSGRVACSRRGRGRRPRRPRRERRNGDSCAGGAGRPRRRSAQGGPRLDSAPNPWHTAETGSVCRSSRRSRGSRMALRTLTPHLSPPRTLPERAAPRQRRRCGRRRSRGRQRARPPELAKPRRRGFAQRPQLHCCCWYFNLNELNDGPEDRQVSRFAQFYATADSLPTIIRSIWLPGDLVEPESPTFATGCQGSVRDPMQVVTQGRDAGRDKRALLDRAGRLSGRLLASGTSRRWRQAPAAGLPAATTCKPHVSGEGGSCRLSRDTTTTGRRT